MDNGASSYRRFLNGDDNGIIEIVHDFKDGLILYLNGYVKNIHVAEELAEDTFFKLMVKKPKYKKKYAFKTWLYTVGRNVAIDYIRKNSCLLTAPPEDLEAVLWDEETLEKSYLKEEQRIALHKALGILCRDHRNSFSQSRQPSVISLCLLCLCLRNCLSSKACQAGYWICKALSRIRYSLSLSII